MKQRNYGIDLLRIIAMFFVVLIHVLMQGGVIEATENEERKFAIVWLLKIVAYCAVNCYALITGFVYFSEDNKRFKFSNYISLWLQVEFYSVFITLLFWIFHPDLVSIKHLIKVILPVASEQYWYFTAYTGVFFIIPWLNKIVQSLKKENFKGFVICLFCFSLYVTTVSQFGKDPFNLKLGLSFLWLAILYIVGAYIKKYEIYNQFKRKRLIIAIIWLIALTWSWKIGIGKLTIGLFGKKIGDDWLVPYTSPTILAIAIAVVFIFINLNIKKFWQKIIKFISPAAFGVYLIHSQPFIEVYVITGKYACIGDLAIYLIPFAVFGATITIFTIGIFIDKIRGLLFEILKVDKFSENIEKIMRKTLVI